MFHRAVRSLKLSVSYNVCRLELQFDQTLLVQHSVLIVRTLEGTFNKEKAAKVHLQLYLNVQMMKEGESSCVRTKLNCCSMFYQYNVGVRARPG